MTTENFEEMAARMYPSMANEPEAAPKSSNDPGPTTAPEEAIYERFQLPEGLVYDDDGHQEFAAVARKFNLNQEQAQQLVTLHANRFLSSRAKSAPTKESVEARAKAFYSNTRF
jgi:hypothetical protein